MKSCFGSTLMELNLTGKSSKKEKSVKLDIDCENSVGSVFTKQWPEMKHIFQLDNLQKYADHGNGFVAEKLDGSNVAISSNNIISSRRNVLMKNPTEQEMMKFKFSGVTFQKLVGIFHKLRDLVNYFSEIFPFLDIELILYGELVQKGTATCKEDKFRYRQRGIEEGEFYVFGGGIAFEDNLNISQISKALMHLRSKGFAVTNNINERTGRSYLILLMNHVFSNLLASYGIQIVQHKEMSLKQCIQSYREKLMENEIEGIVLNFGDVIVKWKGLDESYPDIFMDQIQLLGTSVDSYIMEAIVSVAEKARYRRNAANKEKSTNILLENAFKSAMTKLRSLQDFCENDSVTDSVVDDFRSSLQCEMMNDCHSFEFESKLKTFIECKIRCMTQE